MRAALYMNLAWGARGFFGFGCDIWGCWAVGLIGRGWLRFLWVGLRV